MAAFTGVVLSPAFLTSDLAGVTTVASASAASAPTESSAVGDQAREHDNSVGTAIVDADTPLASLPPAVDTVIVMDINPVLRPNGSSNLSQFTALGTGMMVFSANDGTHGNELCWSRTIYFFWLHI